jgi:predicted ferric reductase
LEKSYEELEPTVPLAALIGMLLAVLLGVFMAVVAVPIMAPNLAATLFGEAPKAYWYLSRSSGLAAYGLLWISMAMGLLISNKMARIWPGGPTAFELHQYTSLLGLNLALFHMLILLGDRFIEYKLVQLLLPFESVNYQPFAVGLGQTAFYALIIISISFYLRKLIGHRLWRLVHYVSFAGFLLVAVHGWLAGSDSGTPVAQALYLGSAISLVFLLIYRLIAAAIAIEKPGRKRSRQAG